MLVLYREEKLGPFSTAEDGLGVARKLRGKVGSDMIRVIPDGKYHPQNRLYVIKTVRIGVADDMEGIAELIPSQSRGFGNYRVDYINDLTEFQCNLAEHDNVYWTDPDDGTCSGFGQITGEVRKDDYEHTEEDDHITVYLAGGSEVEALPEELSSPSKHLPEFQMDAGLITYHEDETEEVMCCLGPLLCLRDKVYDANFGQLDITVERAEAHNKLYDEGLLSGLDERCEIGMGNTFYFDEKKMEVNTFAGLLVSADVVVTPNKIWFRRNDMTFEGPREEDADCFSFARLT